MELDDCWMAGSRLANGRLTWNPARFPEGIPSLWQQIHSMGLRFGIYESIGVRTCSLLPGSWGHYMQDARTFASWGVDFVKMDSCQILRSIPRYKNPLTQEKLFNQFSAALTAVNATGHSIVYSQELPRRGDPSYAASPDFLRFVTDSARTSNMWRITPDEEPKQHPAAVLTVGLNTDLPLWKYAGSGDSWGGGWNDLDYLTAGTPRSDGPER